MRIVPVRLSVIVVADKIRFCNDDALKVRMPGVDPFIENRDTHVPVALRHGPRGKRVHVRPHHARIARVVQVPLIAGSVRARPRGTPDRSEEIGMRAGNVAPAMDLRRDLKAHRHPVACISGGLEQDFSVSAILDLFESKLAAGESDFGCPGAVQHDGFGGDEASVGPCALHAKSRFADFAESRVQTLALGLERVSNAEPELTLGARFPRP